MDTFTAIDFETAQGYRWSICQVGLVRFERGIITKEVNLLVQPPENYYWSRFTDIHSISFKNTLNTPTFDQVWNQIAPYIENQNVITHNGFGFDFPVLDKTLGYYNLPTSDYNKFYTYKIYRSNLANLCEEQHPTKSSRCVERCQGLSGVVNEEFAKKIKGLQYLDKITFRKIKT